MKTLAALTLCILATALALEAPAARIGGSPGTLLSYHGTNILPRSSLDSNDFGWDGTNITVKSSFDGDMNCQPLTDVESQTDCNGCFTHYPDGAIGVPSGVIVYGCDSNSPAVGDMICSNEVWTAEQISSTSSGGFYDNASTTNRFLRYVCREWDGDSWEVVNNQDIDGTVNIHGNLILIDGLGTNLISAGARGNILMGTNNGTIYIGPQSHGNIVQARIGSGSMLTIGTNCNVNKIAAWIDGGSGETLIVVNGSSGNTITHRSADEKSRLDNSSWNYVDANDTFLTNCSYNVIVASSTQTNAMYNRVVSDTLNIGGVTATEIEGTLTDSSDKLPTSAAVLDWSTNINGDVGLAMNGASIKGGAGEGSLEITTGTNGVVTIGDGGVAVSGGLNAGGSIAASGSVQANDAVVANNSIRVESGTYSIGSYSDGRYWITNGLSLVGSGGESNAFTGGLMTDTNALRGWVVEVAGGGVATTPWLDYVEAYMTNLQAFGASSLTDVMYDSEISDDNNVHSWGVVTFSSTGMIYINGWVSFGKIADGRQYDVRVRRNADTPKLAPSLFNAAAGASPTAEVIYQGYNDAATNRWRVALYQQDISARTNTAGSSATAQYTGLRAYRFRNAGE